MDFLQKSIIVAAVYYNRSSWHELIKFINPHLKEAHKNGSLDTYSINFGLYGGDHIKLILKPSGNGNEFEKNADSLIKQFLLSNPSETNTIEYPLNTFFMNHPNNSVWFHQTNESAFFNSIQYKESDYMRCQISQALLEALGSEEIDLASIYTFISYMQIGILKAAYPDIKLAQANSIDLICYLNELKDFEETEIDSKGEKDNQYFKQLFEGNQGILLEIVKDIWEPGGTDSELKWMGAWEVACKNFLVESDFKTSFILLSNLVYEQMGFMHNKNLLQLSLKLISASFRTGKN
jgi:hypothetical protein